MYRRVKFILYLSCIIQPIASNLENDNPVAAVVHKTLKATARSCMTKINATEDDLESLRKDPPFPEKSACIITCLLEKIGIVKDNDFSKTGFVKIVTPLVFSNKKRLNHMKNVSENCDKEINREGSSCQLGNEITICIFKYAPELHFKANIPRITLELPQNSMQEEGSLSYNGSKAILYESLRTCLIHYISTETPIAP